ncbi:three-helix bundle dimerization domain-containing protein [Kutzneria sp. 744]|uniref:arsenate reductase/protein-tyrosine-phosphatase family protein n=1 Tax=Kutzneria sp. (strain 744) TaxID=345341 RepID=UPI0003EED34A|nr:low molecular weight phosphatase family protein [Kutzneria sp. 744]EWM19045.1 arsenate reductase [Kutzneria sp. 744]
MTRADHGLPAREVLHQLDRVAAELADKFHGVFGPETVKRYVQETYDLLAADATIAVHLPVLAARFARERLTDLGKTQGLIRSTVPQVLFVCVHNAGRSQMAAALLDHHTSGRIVVRSAGSRPAGDTPAIITVALAELGVAMVEPYPKPLTDEAIHASDVVVTTGCGDACPVYQGKRYLDWDVEDPADKPLAQIRPIRDELDRRVRLLVEELLA